MEEDKSGSTASRAAVETICEIAKRLGGEEAHFDVIEVIETLNASECALAAMAFESMNLEIAPEVPLLAYHHLLSDSKTFPTESKLFSEKTLTGAKELFDELINKKSIEYKVDEAEFKCVPWNERELVSIKYDMENIDELLKSTFPYTKADDYQFEWFVAASCKRGDDKLRAAQIATSFTDGVGLLKRTLERYSAELQNDASLWSILMYAVIAGNDDSVEFILSSNPSLVGDDEWKQRYLFVIACLFGKDRVVELLASKFELPRPALRKLRDRVIPVRVLYFLLNKFAMNMAGLDLELTLARNVVRHGLGVEYMQRIYGLAFVTSIYGSLDELMREAMRSKKVRYFHDMISSIRWKKLYGYAATSFIDNWLREDGLDDKYLVRVWHIHMKKWHVPKEIEDEVDKLALALSSADGSTFSIASWKRSKEGH